MFQQGYESKKDEFVIETKVDYETKQKDQLQD